MAQGDDLQLSGDLACENAQVRGRLEVNGQPIVPGGVIAGLPVSIGGSSFGYLGMLVNASITVVDGNNDPVPYVAVRWWMSDPSAFVAWPKQLTSVDALDGDAPYFGTSQDISGQRMWGEVWTNAAGVSAVEIDCSAGAAPGDTRRIWAAVIGGAVPPRTWDVTF